MGRRGTKLKGQHFLLSPEARTISLTELFKWTDNRVFRKFCELRWGHKLKQGCPHCAVFDKHQFFETEKKGLDGKKAPGRWRCKHCHKFFSLTSGTVFNSHKLPLRTLLAAMVLYVNSVKGLSALQMSREIGVSYKTAYVLLQKFRDTLYNQRILNPLEGIVEIDGGYLHTAVRKENKKADRKDLRLEENQNPLKCTVLALRQRSEDFNKGAERSITVILKSENPDDVLAAVERYVKPGSYIFTDGHKAYSALSSHPDYLHDVVNHEEEYQSDSGIDQNQAESFFSRMRRLFEGQIHKSAQKHLDLYANEIVFREDWRRESNGTQFNFLGRSLLRSAPSRDFAKYWQGNKKTRGAIVTAADLQLGSVHPFV